MALLDVTIDALYDPMLFDSFKVQRRTDTVGNNGRTTQTTSTFSVQGVVTSTSPNDLERLEGYQVTQRAISVVTKFKLQGEVTGMQPDVVIWRGDRYVVKHIDYYPQFGQGFYQADCVSMDKTDASFPDVTPQLAFNKASNSQYIPLR